MNNTIKQGIVAFVSGALCLYAIFLKTMLVHYNNQISWEYLGFITPPIIGISSISILLVTLLKIKKWYLSTFIAIITVIIGATIYVQYTIKI